jgi:HEAT repeat protein
MNWSAPARHRPLGKIADPEAAHALRAALCDISPCVRASAATAIGRLRVSGTSQWLEPMLTDRHPAVRSAASAAIRRSTDTSAYSGSARRCCGVEMKGDRAGAANHTRRSSAGLFTKVHDRVLAPLFTAGQPQAPPQLRAALTTIQRHIDDRLASARLPTAA